MSDDHSLLTPLLSAFAETDPLRHRLMIVLRALPVDVQRGFVEDPNFRIAKLGGNAAHQATLLALPAPRGRGSRCVVLKERLAKCSEPFGLYVIAHELAHAHLFNGSWGDFSDPEDAADALAASWGFPRPAIRR